MNLDMEHMWDSMKDVYYRRILEQLKEDLGRAEEMETALTAVLDKVVRAVHAEAGTFWYYDRFGDNRIHPKAVYGGGDIGGYSLAPGEGVAGQVIETGAAAIIPDCQKDPRWAGKVDKKTGFCTKTMICVPLAIENIVYGSIQIINKTDNMSFDEKDLYFAENLAKEAGIMLSKQALLGNYMALAGRGSGDPVTLESIVCADTMNDMEKMLRQAICFQKLETGNQQQVLEKMQEIYRIFAKRESHTEPEQPEKQKKTGWFSFLK